MKSALILAALLTLSGCYTLSGLVDAGAKANHAAAESAEIVLCRGMSVGEWIRRYAGDPAKAKAWKVICSDQIKAMP